MQTALETLKILYEDYRRGAKFNDEEQDELIYPNEFVMINLGVFGMCRKSNEFDLVGYIASNLKRNVCLTYLSDSYKSSSSVRSAIAALKRMKIIRNTEKPNLYFVDPFYIRRGEVLSALLSTIKVLENEELSKECIRDRNKIKVAKREMKQAS